MCLSRGTVYLSFLPATAVYFLCTHPGTRANGVIFRCYARARTAALVSFSRFSPRVPPRCVQAPAPKAPPPKASPTSTFVAPPPKAAEVIPAKALAVAPSVEEPIPAPQAAAPPVEEAIASPEPAAPPALEEPVAPPAPEEAAPPAEEASELPAPDKAPPAPEEAAIKIQAAFRGRIARKSLKTLRSEENAAVLHSRPGAREMTFATAICIAQISCAGSLPLLATERYWCSTCRHWRQYFDGRIQRSWND
jgi:hypothetical protein